MLLQVLRFNSRRKRTMTTPLLKKIGFKPGMRSILIDAPLAVIEHFDKARRLASMQPGPQSSSPFRRKASSTTTAMGS
jgi:hypothetical protein